MCVAGCNAKFVIRSAVVKADELNAAVRIKIYQIAIRWRASHPCKYANAPVVARRYPVNLLLEDAPGSDIAGQQQGFTTAGRCSKRYTVGSEALIGERAEVTPTAKLDLTGEIGIAFLVIPGVLNLPEHQGRVVDPEIHAVPIALLGITWARSRLISVKDATQDG